MTDPTTLTHAPGMAEAQAENDRLNLLGPEAAAAFWSEGAPEVHSVEELTYPGGAGQDQRMRLYRASDATAPVVVDIHGGGWTQGSIEQHDWCSRALAASGWHVASISYRLTPGHPFPAGLEDCLSAIRWLASGQGPSGIDGSRMALAGASAGANLALASALSLPGGSLSALVLFYGVYGRDFGTESYRGFVEGQGLSPTRMRELFAMYDPEGRQVGNPLVTPMDATDAALAALPPSLCVACGIDVLRSEDEAMAARLAAAGVAVEAWTEPGVTHGFINRGRLVPSARNVLRKAADFLARHA